MKLGAQSRELVASEKLKTETQMPALFLRTSNRLMSLSEELATLLAAPASLPLTQEIVVVPSLGIRRWLSLEIARLSGVYANISFPFVAVLALGPR